jgi:hypothetical protein
MMRVMITGLAVVVVIAGSSILLRSRTSLDNLSAGTAAMPSLLELHAAVGVHTLVSKRGKGPITETASIQHSERTKFPNAANE